MKAEIFAQTAKIPHVARRECQRRTEGTSIMSRTYEKLTEQEATAADGLLATPNLPATSQQQLPAKSDDGWGDTAAEIESQVLRGKLLKFADWRWTKGTESDEVEEGTQLVAIGTAAAQVKWAGGKPVQYVARQPGKMLPHRDELGDNDESLWELGPDDSPRDPWQNTRFVYFLDPISMEMLTFSTSSGGGRSAVINLADQIKRMRELGRSSALPVVELSAEKMQTKFGLKSKPMFKIVKWYNGGSENGGGPKEIAPPSLKEEMNDDIPFSL
jgi:hypothetical protein